MQVVHPVCCGLDVHKKVVVGCLRRDGGGGNVSKETRSFETTLSGLGELKGWLEEQGCKVVAMESTGVYWKPVYYVLEEQFEVTVANPRDLRQRRGKKTDKMDAAWISELLAHGLVPNSFIPPRDIGALRDLTRTAAALVQTRTQAKNRVHKVLEDTNIKLASVVTDLFGKSPRAMLEALVNGERNPRRLAQLALGRLRNKLPELELSLAGRFSEHHAAIIRMALAQIDLYDQHLAELDRLVAALLERRPEITSAAEQLRSIPGVERRSAQAIIAEIGVDMHQFGSDKRLASWAGVCPGNNESAGKRRSGRTRKANRWLRRTLDQCAWAARKTDTFLGRTFRTLQSRIGGKKAAMAIAHKILIITYHLLSTGTLYDDEVYRRTNPDLEARWANNAVRTLERLGYKLTLERAA